MLNITEIDLYKAASRYAHAPSGRQVGRALVVKVGQIHPAIRRLLMAR
jgi:hypothetical protein